MRHGKFFFHGFGLSLGANLVSTNDRPSFFSIIFRRFPSAINKKCAAFGTNRLEVLLQGMSVDFFHNV